MATQNARLLCWLQSHDGVTTLEAMSNLKCCRLSQRIIELERLGFTFSRTNETTPHGAHVVRYRLLKAAGRDALDRVADTTPFIAAYPVSGARGVNLPVPAAPTVGARLTLFGRKVEVTHVGISAYDGSAWMATREVI